MSSLCKKNHSACLKAFENTDLLATLIAMGVRQKKQEEPKDEKIPEKEEKDDAGALTPENREELDREEVSRSQVSLGSQASMGGSCLLQSVEDKLALAEKEGSLDLIVEVLEEFKLEGQGIGEIGEERCESLVSRVISVLSSSKVVSALTSDEAGYAVQASQLMPLLMQLHHFGLIFVIAKRLIQSQIQSQAWKVVKGVVWNYAKGNSRIQEVSSEQKSILQSIWGLFSKAEEKSAQVVEGVKEEASALLDVQV